jgi:hypothetical protein
MPGLDKEQRGGALALAKQFPSQAGFSALGLQWWMGNNLARFARGMQVMHTANSITANGYSTIIAYSL